MLFDRSSPLGDFSRRPAGAGRRHLSALLLSAVVAASGAGCASYEPLPLAPASVRDEFLARTAEDPGLVAFAAALNAHGAAPVFDPADGLSAAEAETVALFFNPELRRLRAETGVAAALARTAGAFADPVFGLDAERIVESVDEPWVIGGTVEFSLPLSGRRSAERDAAARIYDADAARVRTAEWETRLAVRRAYARLAAAERRAEAFAAQRAAFEPAAKVVEIMQSAGEIPRTEARLYALERAVRGAEAEAATYAVADESRKLRALLGLPPDSAVRLVAATSATPHPAEAEARAAALERNPRLRERAAAYEASEAALRLEVARQFPDLSLSPGFASDEGVARVLLGLAAAPPLFDGNRRGIAEAEARRLAEREAFAAATAAVYGELGAGRARAEQAARLRERLVAAAALADEQSADLRRTAEAGRFDPVAILESLNRVHDIRLRLIEARLAEAEAALDVEAAIGPPPPAQPVSTPPAPSDSTAEGSAGEKSP